MAHISWNVPWVWCWAVYSIQSAIQMQELLQDFVGQKKMGLLIIIIIVVMSSYMMTFWEAWAWLLIIYLYISGCWTYGGMVVHPSVQGNGIGTRALQLALKESDAARRPVLLTTNEARKLWNLPWWPYCFFFFFFLGGQRGVKGKVELNNCKFLEGY